MKHLWEMITDDEDYNWKWYITKEKYLENRKVVLPCCYLCNKFTFEKTYNGYSIWYEVD